MNNVETLVHMFYNYQETAIKEKNNDIIFIETLIEYLSKTRNNDWRSNDVFRNLCKYVFFSGQQGLIENYINTLNKLSINFGNNLFYNLHNIDLNVFDKLTDKEISLLLDYKYPIQINELKSYKKTKIWKYIDGIEINDNNFTLLIPGCNEVNFQKIQDKNILLSNKYGKINLESLKLIKITFSKKIIETFLDVCFYHNIKNGSEIYKYYKDELKNGNLIKFVNKCKTDHFVNLILEKYPNIKFDLTEKKHLGYVTDDYYSKSAFEKILKNKNYYDFDPIEVTDSDLDLMNKYNFSLTLCFIDDKIINEYYKNNVISNKEFIECVDKLMKNKIIEEEHIERVFNKDKSLITFENVKYILEKYFYRKYDSWSYEKFVKYLYKNKKIDHFSNDEKNNLLFIISRKSFDLFCFHVYGKCDALKKDFEIYDKTLETKFNEDHILALTYCKPNKSKFLNLIKILLSQNEINKINELYLLCTINCISNVAKLLENKVSDDFKKMINDTKITIELSNYRVEFIYK